MGLARHHYAFIGCLQKVALDQSVSTFVEPLFLGSGSRLLDAEVEDTRLHQLESS